MIPSTMMRMPLLISSVIEHAARWHSDGEVVSVGKNGRTRFGYGEIASRAKQLARALTDMGMSRGARVGTLALNTHRHLEAYYAVSGAGMVCHTINPRLSMAQLAFVIRHAGDQVLLVDAAFLPIAQQAAAAAGTVQSIIVFDPEGVGIDDRVLVYETFLESHPGGFSWPELDENEAAVLCYTSGTTGDPKGVTYSHRSALLHAIAQSMPDGLCIGQADVVCPVVPMFHVSAWGMPYAAPMTGANLVLPGAALDGESLYHLFEEEGVTIALGVPTIWIGLLEGMRRAGTSFSTLRRIGVGGAAIPAALIREFEDVHKVEVIHAWGMTETSPLGTCGKLTRKLQAQDRDIQIAAKAKQGRAVFGVELRIEDADGRPVPHDGQARGELHVRGQWVTGSYFDAAHGESFTTDGWFKTGDVATIDPDGYVAIVDRMKDLVKSGGEWISSIQVESAALEYDAVLEAAVIGIPDPLWQERPLLLVVPRPNVELMVDALRRRLGDTLPKWCIPDRIELVEQLPHGATGKVDKRALREAYASTSGELAF